MSGEAKRQLRSLPESMTTMKKPSYCQCCGSTEVISGCASCGTPLCAACAHFDGCPSCDLDDEGNSPECTQ